MDETRPCCCYDNQYRPTYHNQTTQRYVSPTTGRCKPLVVQAVRPTHLSKTTVETAVAENTPKARKLAIWLVLHPPVKLDQIPRWFFRWVWFTLGLIWPFNAPKYTGLYPAYLSKCYGQLWVARSPREYALRTTQLGAEPVRDITHGTHPRRLVIYDPDSQSWQVTSDPEKIKQHKYVTISYRRDDIIRRDDPEAQRLACRAKFIAQVQDVMASLGQTAYWVDLTLIDKSENPPPEEIDKDVYRMSDVYRGAELTLIMLCPFSTSSDITENDSGAAEAWKLYGERLWTFPETLLSRKLRFMFGKDGKVENITLHQLANRAYAAFSEESAIVNAYGLRDPLERLERLSLLRSALWRRTSYTLEKLKEPGAKPKFRAERVYALMGFFEHRIHPHFQETELQALVRLSMANDNDRLVERMVSLLPSRIQATTSWYAEEDDWGANLWDIEPEIQVVGMTEREALVIGGCRAATIRWKDFPLVAFAMRRSYKRIIANYLPNLFWELLIIGIIQAAISRQSVFTVDQFGVLTQTYRTPPSALALLVIALVLLLLAPLLVAYGTSGRIVLSQPWLVGVKGLISAEEASEYLYGGVILNALPRTSYSPTGTLLSKAEKGEFRRGDPAQLDDIRQNSSGSEDDNLYTLIDTQSATIYYFRAERPPTVCLYTGRESGMGRFVLCSERCIENELHKETVIRMPWHISQSMRACDWVALN